MPTLELHNHVGITIGSWNASGAEGPASPLQVEESGRYSFSLRNAEPEMDYDIQIGDLGIAEVVGRSFMPGGVYHQRVGTGSVYWVAAQYFESGRGITKITLRQSGESANDWQAVASISLYVLPTKLGEERYEAMLEGLQRLCAGLVLDLIGKSTRSYEHMLVKRGISYASKEMELRRVETVWSSLAPLVYRIATSPMSIPRRCVCSDLYWGDKSMSPVSLARMARRGFSPRSTLRPVRATLTKVRETTDIAEHAFLLGFLKLLHARIGQCVAAIVHQTRMIESNRIFRDVSFGDGSSLYAQFDAPRLHRLALVRRQAEATAAMIANVANMPLFDGLRPQLIGLKCHSFSQNALYRSAFRLMRQYLTAASIWIGNPLSSGDATVKLTSRLYEHWVFLRLVDAFRTAGVKLDPWDEFLRESVRSHFSLEFDRELRFTGPIGNGLLLQVTFEPWITSRSEALRRGTSVFKDGGQQAWSPDILIELIVSGTTRYAIVLDCKYSRNLGEDAWHTEKYLRIRAVQTGSQVVRQLWLVHPATHCSILPLDEVVRFEDGGVNSPWDENVLGVLGVLPGTDGSEEKQVLQRFASGTLSYLRQMASTLSSVN